jgi:hypothetical protein
MFGCVTLLFVFNERAQDSAYFIDKEGNCTRWLASSKTLRRLLAHKKTR